MHLDLVLPAHNEAQRIGPTLDRYRRVLTGADVRFIIALDGCTDSTASIVAEHHRADPRVVALELPKLGKGGVLAEAIRTCTAPLIGFVDADGATPPSELLRLVAVVEHGTADVAIASRRLPASVVPTRRTVGRRIASAGFASATRHLFDLPYADTQCGAKVLHRRAAGQIVPLLSSRDFLFDVDLLLAARDLELRVEEVPTMWIDQDGSKVDAVRDARRMAASALRLWLHHRVLPTPQPSLVLEPVTAAAPTPPGGSIDLRDDVIDLTRPLPAVPSRDNGLVHA